MQPVDIIVPVYGGLDDLRLCLDSVLAASQAIAHRVIVIDDASPDPDIQDYLQALERRSPTLEVLVNDHNRGFVGTVNRGMSLHPERDVVLLNSDTSVSGDWLDRLHRCATAAVDIGTVTPFSNNATICSFPEFCGDNPLPSGWNPESLDQVFRRCNAGASVPIPTAVGFCMYIRRPCLAEVGLFDEASFGRGYGEENDFCMRATRAGFKHLLCADTFVYHKGGVSFGSEKDERVAAALETLNALHADYPSLVAAHLREDPAEQHRVRVLLELHRENAALTVLHLTHFMGGGTQKHIEDLDQHLDGAAQSLVLRPGADGELVLSLGVSKDCAALVFRLPLDQDLLLGACRYLGVGRVHFHHTMGLDPWLWLLARRLGVPLDLTLHDYYLINANPTLIDENARFCERQEDRDQRCVRAYPIPGGVDADHWRRNQMLLLDEAQRVFAPCRYTEGLYKTYFPGLRTIVASHPDWERDAPYRPPAQALDRAPGPLRILVLGALSREKGADVLEQTALHCAKLEQPVRFVLLGYAYRQLAPEVHQRGVYRDAELDKLISAEQPDLIWFPAQWPETYSYTLSAALRSALPIAAPDIGSFPERLRGRPLTWIKPWGWSPANWSELFVSLARSLRSPADQQPSGWSQETPADAPFCYARDYAVAGVAEESPPSDPSFADQLAARVATADQAGRVLTRRERVLRRLIRLREGRAVSAAVRLVPFSVQRRIKRLLSSRPIHDIISD